MPIAELFVTVGADVSQLTSGLNGISSQVTKFGNQIQSAGRDLTAGLTVPIVGAAAVVTKLGSDFEQSMAGVKKTVGDLSGGTIEDFGNDLLNLSTTVQGGGLDASKLANIAEVAGAMGITGRKELTAFTATVAQMSNAIDGMDPSALAASLGVIATLTGETGPESFNKIGSAITALGNDMQGLEPQLIETATRVAGTLSALGVSAKDILGIASAATAVGVMPESAGTSIQTFFLDMNAAISGTSQVTPEAAKKMQNLQDRVTDLSTSLQTAKDRMAQFGRNTPKSTVDAAKASIAKYERELGQANTELATLTAESAGGGKDLQNFANVANMSADGFKALFKENPAKAFEAIIVGLAKMNEADPGGGLDKGLKQLGVTGKREIQLITGLVKGLGTESSSLSAALGVSNKAWEDNNALQKENAIFMDTTGKKFDILKNKLAKMAIEGWNRLKGAVQGVMNEFDTRVIPLLQKVEDGFFKLSPDMQKSILLFAGIAAALGPGLVILGLAVTAIGALISPLALVIFVVGALAVAWASNWGGIRDKVGEAVAAIVKLLTGDLGRALQIIAIAAVILAVIVGAQLARMVASWAATAAAWLSNAVKIAAGWAIAFAPALLTAIAVAGVVALIATALVFIKRAWDTNWNNMREPVANLIEVVANLFDLLSKFPLGFAGTQAAQWKEMADEAKQFVANVRGGQSAIPALQGVGDAIDKIDTGGSTIFDQFQKGFPDLQKQIASGTVAGAVGVTPALAATGVPTDPLVQTLQQLLANQTAPATGTNVAVNINNPVVPDLATGDAFAQQIQTALVDILATTAEKTVSLPQPALPGQGPF